MSELVALAGRSPSPSISGATFATLKRLGIPEPAILKQPAIRRAMPLLAGLLALAALAFGIMAFRTPPRAQLFPGLADADKGAIVDALHAGGFDVRVDSSTGAVEVPADDLYRARMALAQAGLPKAVPGGYDLLSNMPLGASRALERARLKQAQEGELARAVEAIGGVQSARVMIALPESSPFVRDEAPTTASVFVSLRSGRALGDAQVRAIQHLVASSIPGLSSERVSVVDGAGALLSADPEDGDLGASQRQLAYAARLERGYRDRIAALLGPVLGAGNFSAQVHADVDFTEQQATKESYAPGNSAVRSEVTSNRSDTSAPARGIPGAISNIAPPAPTVGSAPPSPAPGSAPANPVSTESASTRNFEVGKEVAVTRMPVGGVRRLAVAVVVRAAPSAGGAAPDLATLQRLVAAAVGLDTKRGDVVSIVREPFVVTPLDAGQPLWRTIVDDHSGHLVALIAILAAVLVARPLLRRAAPKPAIVEATARDSIVGGVPAPLALEDAEAARQARAEQAERERLDAEAEAELARARKPSATDILSNANTYDDKVAAIRLFVAEDPARATAVFKQMLRDKEGT